MTTELQTSCYASTAYDSRRDDEYIEYHMKYHKEYQQNIQANYPGCKSFKWNTDAPYYMTGMLGRFRGKYMYAKKQSQEFLLPIDSINSKEGYIKLRRPAFPVFSLGMLWAFLAEMGVMYIQFMLPFWIFFMCFGGYFHLAKYNIFDLHFAFWAIVPGYLMYFSSFIVKRLAKLDYYHTFNRRTGMVEFWESTTEKVEYPFYEMIPIYTPITQSVGLVRNARNRFEMRLMHIKTGKSMFLSGFSIGEGIAMWAFLRQYMDVTKPLPDVPVFEEIRHLDPITKAYDIKTNRDPHFWKKKSMDEMLAYIKDQEKQMNAAFHSNVTQWF